MNQFCIFSKYTHICIYIYIYIYIDIYIYIYICIVYAGFGARPAEGESNTALADHSSLFVGNLCHASGHLRERLGHLDHHLPQLSNRERDHHLSQLLTRPERHHRVGRGWFTNSQTRLLHANEGNQTTRTETFAMPAGTCPPSRKSDQGLIVIGNLRHSSTSEWQSGSRIRILSR